MPRTLRPLVPALLLAALVAAGCGSKADDSASGSGASAATAKATATSASAATSPSQAVAAIAGGISHKLSQRPKIPTPHGTPPRKLVVRDIVRGKGRKVKAGDTVTVQYVGASWSNGREFDASWNRGQAFTFQVPGQVIEGWNEGVLGMREGGRRLLIIPPAKGYGTQGTPDGSIQPNETLAFVVDLVKDR